MITAIANTIDPSIVMSSEVPSDHPELGNRLPVLETPVSIGRDDRIKGVEKKCDSLKISKCHLPRTNCPRRLSFSQFVVLMSTTNCEKDSLLGQLVLGR